ncbi:L-histidine N(alpha)-methyltransferase [Ideonella sp. BN130291]|uniref:L-histidine N(alpha)-methyltransferase n=1 Tax=Ideonella sp. BN130291 TaxID=3112940 RepID=UPI002E268CC6|nr:L-histidine N(alpha)-methyltransferase [Ideonella sp. BN130291]
MAEGSHLFVQRIDTPAERRQELLAGLLDRPARIPPKFFYDAQGSALYEAICALDEYYPPRTEAAIFDRYQRDIAAALPREAQFVDLGCGDGAKAWRWIEALGVQRYVGVDIAEPWLRATLQRGAHRFPQVSFDGVVTDFTRGLSLQSVLRPDQPCVFFYPGSSIGNFEPAVALRLLREMRHHLRGADRLLIGVDTPKPMAPLLAAYDDALGVTAAFNRNVLRVVNRELGSDFPLVQFDHRAVFNDAHSRIEMHLVANRPTQVRLADGLQRRFDAGEAIVTEYSYKHSAEAFAQLLAEAGFGAVRHWTDEQRWFGVFVAAPGAVSS